MNSRTTARFWKRFAELPAAVRKRAKNAYRQFLTNPYHPSLHFKQVHSSRPVFSVRITKDYRSVGILQDDDIIWFWIGSHSDYEKLLNNMRNA